jgi:hypothetical protein
MLQGVREIFELIDSADADSDTSSAPTEGKIVIIGKNIAKGDKASAFQRSLTEYLVG